MDTIQETSPSHYQSSKCPGNYVREYLCSHSTTFRELARVQEEGWKMPSGDAYFRKQRQTADNADQKTSLHFFKLMQQIGDEMHKSTGAMDLADNRQILDLCMAPGGYSSAALKVHPNASVSGATLPMKLGGHKLLLQYGPMNPSVQVWQGDLTLLVGDMGIDESDIPDKHSDYGEMQKREVWAGKRFGLVFCDGQVLRNHADSMADNRKRCEATRLTCSQLLIALRHVAVGGTLVILLHRLDRWDTFLTLRAFDRFANIQLFKPLSGHRSRGSFYLVAKNIQPHHKDALQAIQGWTKIWKDATFWVPPKNGQESAVSSDEGEEQVSTPVSEQQIMRFLDDFGEKLITLGERIWSIQKKAIEDTPWFKKMKAKEEEEGLSTLEAVTDISGKIEKRLVVSEGRYEQDLYWK